LLGLLQLVLDGNLDDETRLIAQEARSAGERLYEHHRDLVELAQAGIACTSDEPAEQIDLKEAVVKLHDLPSSRSRRRGARQS
jgi:hypothetical protein